MYCPQCSQEQSAGELRFCSRCGFPLTIVSQLVVNGGALAGFDWEGRRLLTPRQKGIRWGALLMIISGVMIPIVALMTAMKDDAAVLFFPVGLIFLVGLARLIYGYLLQTDAPSQKDHRSAAVLNAARRSALPPQQSMPVTNWRPPIDTSEMAQPASVTDHTTKLLKDSD
jgi:hypothetical protein